MSTVLGFDTSTGACSAAVLRDGALLARAFEPMARGQAERLLPMIGELMTEAELTFADLDLIATTTGPGAFTGLRIGLSAAQGLTLATDCPGCGITTFEAIIEAVLRTDRKEIDQATCIAIAVESKREDVFIQLFDKAGEAIDEPKALMPGALATYLPCGPMIFAGDAAERCLPHLDHGQRDVTIINGASFVDAFDVASIGDRRLNGGEALAPLLPLYLRPPDAKIPKDGGELRPTDG